MAKHVAFTGAGRLSHARQVLSDLDVQIDLRPTDLTPAAAMPVLGEFNTTGNLRGWLVEISTTGTVVFRWSNNGTASLSATSTVSLTTVRSDAERFWLRVTFDVDNGAAGRTARFYTSDDGVTWTQLGADVTSATATSIFSSASNVITLGGQATAAAYVGKVYAVRLYSTIGGTTNLVDPDPWDWSTATYGTTGVTTVTPAVTSVEQDSYPPRILISGTDLEEDDVVTLYREVLGERTAVRGAADVTAGDVSLVRIDAEQPFGPSLTYVMVLNDGEEYSATPLVSDLPGGKVVLSDAITGAAAEVVTTAWPERRTERPATRFVVGGRNVAVLGLRPGFQSTIELFTETATDRRTLAALLTSATSGVVQYRSATQGDANDCYLAVLADTETRYSQDGSDDRRLWSLDVVEVEPWADSLEAAGFTLEDVYNAYVEPLTLDDLSDDYATLLALAQGDFS